MLKAISMTLVALLLASCTSTNKQLPYRYLDGPNDFKCPSEYFALCEGHNRMNMECQCIDRQYQRKTIESLLGTV